MMQLDIQGVQGVIFDCDGVLIDSRQANVAYYNLILQAIGLPGLRASDEEYVHSHTVTESIRACVPAGRLQEALQAAKSVTYRQVLPHIRIQPGLFKLLDHLRTASFLIGINTNRTNTMHLVLERFDLEPYFFPVMTASAVTWPKPHPESLFTVLRMWGLEPEQAVFIGDTEVDQLTAQAAGVRFWAYQNPQLAADLHLPDYWTALECLTSPTNGSAMGSIDRNRCSALACR